MDFNRLVVSNFSPFFGENNLILVVLLKIATFAPPNQRAKSESEPVNAYSVGII
jgi:hypothetical protein